MALACSSFRSVSAPAVPASDPRRTVEEQPERRDGFEAGAPARDGRGPEPSGEVVPAGRAAGEGDQRFEDVGEHDGVGGRGGGVVGHDGVGRDAS